MPDSLSLVLRGPSHLAQALRPLRVLGIDLGTTNSLVAEVICDPADGGPPQPRCLEVEQETEDGTYVHVLVPSVVAFRPGQTLVGEGAKRLRARASELKLDQNRDIFWDTKNDIGVRRTYHKAPAGARSAKDIAAHLLRFLSDAAQANTAGRPARVVVTVPASFQAAQRADTLEAARLAGIPVGPGDLLDEPLAALLDFLVTRRDRLPAAPAGRERAVLVFDFGGGTCDVAVLRVAFAASGDEVRVAPVAVSRYHRLGGGDFDAAIVHDVLIPQLAAQNGIDARELSYEDKLRFLAPTLLGVAEALKIGLSRELRHRRSFGGKVTVPDDLAKQLAGSYVCRLASGRELILSNPSLSLKEFNRLLVPFLDQDLLHVRETEYRMTTSIFAPLEDALDRSGLEPGDIELCLLVGGSSLLPQVHDAISGYLEKALILDYEDADAAQSAVARGAALHALSLELSGHGLVVPVASEALALRTRAGEFTLLARGARLPFPGDGSWARSEALVVPHTSDAGVTELRIELVGDHSGTVLEQVWELPRIAQPGERLLLRWKLDDNQVLHLDLALASDPEGPRFAARRENPFTNVSNPQPKRAQLLELEERIRTAQMRPAERLEAVSAAAEINAELGQVEKAIDLLKRVAAEDGGRPATLNRLGRLYGSAGDHVREEKFLREAGRDTSWGGSHFNLALSFYKQRRYKEALTEIDVAISRDGEAPYLVLRAMIVIELGQRKDGESCIKDALRRFQNVRTLSPFELHWLTKAAEMAGDKPRLAEARAESRRRERSEHEAEPVASDALLPDLAPGLVRRPS